VYANFYARDSSLRQPGCATIDSKYVAHDSPAVGTFMRDYDANKERQHSFHPMLSSSPSCYELASCVERADLSTKIALEAFHRAFSRFTNPLYFFPLNRPIENPKNTAQLFSFDCFEKGY